MFDALLTGIIQGITEFLPISSSAHLVFVQYFLGWGDPELWFDIVLHVATLGSVVIYLHKDIVALLGSHRRSLALIILASVPTAVIGYALKDHVEHVFSAPQWPAFFLLITGVLLYSTRNREDTGRGQESFTWWEVLVVGVVQGLAVLPGISRAGSTIVTGILLGWKRRDAASFSFLLSMPAIAGAAVLGMRDLSGQSMLPFSSYGIGFVVALLSGIAALSFLFKVLSHKKFHIFAYYCWVVGFGMLILLYLRKGL